MGCSGSKPQVKTSGMSNAASSAPAKNVPTVTINAVLPPDEQVITFTTDDFVGTLPPSDTEGIARFPSFFNPDVKPTIFEYKFIRHIGHGAQSDVFLVLNTLLSQFFAAKVYDKSFLYRTVIGDAEQPIMKVVREIEIMSDMEHPNVLKLIDILEDEFTQTTILILPFAQSGSLSPNSWKANPLPEPKLKFYFRQIASGLEYVHSKNVIHRDIKPDNVLLLDEETCVISDFSVSISLEDENQLIEDTDGTPAFYSPEECSGDPYKGKPADVWSFGMTMYVMAFGRLPFSDSDDEGIFYSQFYRISQSIMNEEIRYPDNIPISKDLSDLFNHILDKNAETRYTMTQILHHRWMAED